jgi:hypothetical protein
MTTFVSGLLLAAALGAGPGDVERAPHDPRDDGQAAVDVSGYPAEQQRQYPIFLLVLQVPPGGARTTRASTPASGSAT